WLAARGGAGMSCVARCSSGRSVFQTPRNTQPAPAARPVHARRGARRARARPG
ncbi:MAG: hypothetical protein AVDCRST_MAG11-2783, partial [uncultured Gemmatimonadaceae bacterium]